jgi:predicted transglutaminase-like cysteine proteinase
MPDNSKTASGKPVTRTLKASPTNSMNKNGIPTKLDKRVLVKAKKKVAAKVNQKVKVVRDSFTMPQSDYSKLEELKLACLKEGISVKKSELLRAGLSVLSKLSMAQLKKTIAQVEQIKTGRPKNN